MLGPIKKLKEINKTFNITQRNNKFIKPVTKASFLLNQKNDLENKSTLILSQFQNKDIVSKFKKNALSPMNKKFLHKSYSISNIYQNQSKEDNNYINNNLNKNGMLTTSRKFNDINFNSSIRSNVNNMAGFNTTKNKNTNYTNSNNNSKAIMHSYDNDSPNLKKMLKKFKNQNFSEFFYKSQNQLISSMRIFRHYLREEQKEKVKPIKFFMRGGKPKSIKKIKELYKVNNKFNQRLKEIKCNSTIALKKDFNILDYQSTLVKLLSKRVSQNNLNVLQNNFIAFNEKNYGLVGPKGRFTNMAEKIKYNIPLYLYEKIRQLDTDKLISRYNYYKNIFDNYKKKFENKNLNKKKNKSVDSSKGNISVDINKSY